MQGMDSDHIGDERMNRRGFLWLMAGGVVTAAASAFGCGGSGGGNGGGKLPIGTITENDRHACLDAIQALLDANSGLTLDEQAAAALAFVRTRPEFVDSDIDEDGVWAFFVDAVPLFLLFNREPDPNPIASLPELGERAPTELPDNATAMLINTLGPAFTDVIPFVKPLLQGNGYSTIVDPGTVASLQAFNDDGIFFMYAHGGMPIIPILTPDGDFELGSNGRPRGRRVYGVWTSDVAVPGSVEAYRDDIDHGRLGIGMARHGTGQPGSPRSVRHYWFTPAFVDTYMNFGLDSLVWFNTCRSNSTISQAFVQSCINAGAGLFVGWNRRTTDGDCIACSKFVFDRLLGANATTPLENPPQRPFDYVEVWQNMAAQGLPSGLIYSVGSGEFGLLAPTIAYILINEFDEEAHLFGIFGNPASNERQVTIGGVTATVKSWAKDKIIVDLPQAGTGSNGDVQVIVRGHKSNIRQITEWRFDIAYDWLHTDLAPLSTAGIFTLMFRADIGHYREHAGVPPLEPVRWAVAKRSSSGGLTGAGTVVDTGGCTNTWSGVADFEAGGFGAAEYMVISRMKIDTDAGTGALGFSLAAFGPPPFNWRIACPGETPIDTPFAVSVGLLEGSQGFASPQPGSSPIQLPFFNLPFTADYTVPARHFIDLTFDPLKIDIAWTAVTATSPPDPNAARSVPDRRGG